jgi:sulfite reductase (NADPH) flavoprotein alpha-component
MSSDVEKALIEIIKTEGEKNDQQAQEYLNQLIEEGRYLKDVY